MVLKGQGVQDTIVTLSIGTDRSEQTIDIVHMLQNTTRSLYTVCHSSSNNLETTVKWICSNVKKSMVRSEGVPEFRVNMVFGLCRS